MMTITKGQGKLGTIYDRLRKRSLRALRSDDWLRAAPVPTVPRMQWVSLEHDAYLQGVRDALQAVENGG